MRPETVDLRIEIDGEADDLADSLVLQFVGRLDVDKRNVAFLGVDHELPAIDDEYAIFTRAFQNNSFHVHAPFSAAWSAFSLRLRLR